MSSKTKTTATKEEAKPALVPKLQFPEFQQAGEWEIKALGQLADYENGKAYEQDIVENGKYVVVNSRFISTDGAVKKYTNAEYLIAKAGEVLMVLSDLPKGRALAKCFYVESNDRYAVNQRVCRLKPRRIEGRFLFYTLNRHPNLLAYDDGLSQTHLSKGGVTECPLCVPSQKAEQQKIAECLSSVDELMTAQARKVDALKTHKKGLQQQLFPREGETQPRLRFPEFQNAGEWEEKKLGSVCDIQRGKFSHRPRNDPRFFGGPYPFIQTGDVVKSEGGAVVASQSLNEEGLAVSKLFKPTIVLITIAANIGDTGLLQTEGCFTDSVVGLVPKKDVIPVFLELIMRGQKENLNKVATTGAQKNINNEILREVSVLLPSVPEQQRIATSLSSLDALITAETQKHEALKTHKKGLMQQLFPSPEEVAA